MKKIVLLISNLTLLMLIFNCSTIVAQNRNLDQKTLTVKSDFVFKINENDLSNLKNEYDFTIKDLKFKSKEELESFCKNFSFEFHSFKGNFDENQITLIIDKASVLRKSYSINDINSRLDMLSRRMQYIYKNL